MSKHNHGGPTAPSWLSDTPERDDERPAHGAHEREPATTGEPKASDSPPPVDPFSDSYNPFAGLVGGAGGFSAATPDSQDDDEDNPLIDVFDATSAAATAPEAQATSGEPEARISEAADVGDSAAAAEPAVFDGMWMPLDPVAEPEQPSSEPAGPEPLAVEPLTEGPPVEIDPPAPPAGAVDASATDGVGTDDEFDDIEARAAQLLARLDRAPSAESDHPEFVIPTLSDEPIDALDEPGLADALTDDVLADDLNTDDEVVFDDGSTAFDDQRAVDEEATLPEDGHLDIVDVPTDADPQRDSGLDVHDDPAQAGEVQDDSVDDIASEPTSTESDAGQPTPSPDAPQAVSDARTTVVRLPVSDAEAAPSSTPAPPAPPEPSAPSTPAAVSPEHDPVQTWVQRRSSPPARPPAEDHLPAADAPAAQRPAPRPRRRRPARPPWQHQSLSAEPDFGTDNATRTTAFESPRSAPVQPAPQHTPEQTEHATPQQPSAPEPSAAPQQPSQPLRPPTPDPGQWYSAPSAPVQHSAPPAAQWVPQQLPPQQFPPQPTPPAGGPSAAQWSPAVPETATTAFRPLPPHHSESPTTAFRPGLPHPESANPAPPSPAPPSPEPADPVPMNPVPTNSVPQTPMPQTPMPPSPMSQTPMSQSPMSQSPMSQTPMPAPQTPSTQNPLPSNPLPQQQNPSAAPAQFPPATRQSQQYPPAAQHYLPPQQAPASPAQYLPAPQQHVPQQPPTAPQQHNPTPPQMPTPQTPTSQLPPTPRQTPSPTTGFGPAHPAGAPQAPGGPQWRPAIVPSLDDARVRNPRSDAPQGGWRRAVHVVSSGHVNPGDSRTVRRQQQLIEKIRQPISGDFRIAMLSMKGGVGKTTTTIGLGSALASVRGDRVIAVDANPDLGTLASRVPQQTASTVRTLLADEHIYRYTDMRRHTSEATSRLEVLASERDPAISESFSADEYRRVLGVLENFYNIIMTDCGTGLMHSAMEAVLSTANAIVLVTSPAVDGAQSASATLDWLNAHGYQHLVNQAIVVISASKPGGAPIDLDLLTQHFLGRTRAVQVIPYDDHLATGSYVDLDHLHRRTRTAFLELAATVADSFISPAIPPASAAPHAWQG